MPFFSMQEIVAIVKGKIAIITVVLASVTLLLLTVVIFRSRSGSRNNNTVPSPTIGASKIPEPTQRRDVHFITDVYKSINFPVEITIPKTLGMAKIVISDFPQAKGELNPNGVMEVVTFEKSDIYVGIMAKLFNEEFLQEKSRFDFIADNTTYEMVVSQYVKSQREADPQLLARYETRFGKYFIRATNIRNSMQYVTITAPVVTDQKKAIQELENLIRNIKIN